MRNKPKLEDLVLTRMCELPGWADEAEVMKFADPADKWEPEDFVRFTSSARQIDTAMWFTGLFRSCIGFCIDSDVLLEAVQSGDNQTLPPLPPLPFRKIAVQASDNGPLFAVEGHALAAMDGKRYATEAATTIVAQAIFEIERGTRWRVIQAGIVQNEKIFALAAHDITPETIRPLAYPSRGAYDPIKFADVGYVPDSCRLAVEAAHLITSRGVSLVEVDAADRHERKRLARRNSRPPRLYWVDINAGQVTRIDGPAAREYHCRWLVRGHWRHFASGDRTWVKSYIKGPAGAPWRGRPVYMVEGAA